MIAQGIHVLNMNIYLIKNWMSCHVENVNLYIPLFNCDPVEAKHHPRFGQFITNHDSSNSYILIYICNFDLLGNTIVNSYCSKVFMNKSLLKVSFDNTALQNML